MKRSHWFNLSRTKPSSRGMSCAGPRVLAALLVASVVLLTLALLPTPAAHAQNPEDGFDTQADNGVKALAVQSDGKIVVGGYFTTLAGGGAAASVGSNPTAG